MTRTFPEKSYKFIIILTIINTLNTLVPPLFRVPQKSGLPSIKGGGGGGGETMDIFYWLLNKPKKFGVLREPDRHKFLAPKFLRSKFCIPNLAVQNCFPTCYLFLREHYSYHIGFCSETLWDNMTARLDQSIILSLKRLPLRHIYVSFCQ